MPESLAAIAAEPPGLPVEQVAEDLAKNFDIHGELQPLVSERDQNFRVTTASGARYVAKVVSPEDDAERVDFQIGVLRHLERKGQKNVPKVIPTVDGNAYASVVDPLGGGRLALRLVTWIEGTPCPDGPPTTAAAAGLGRVVARLNLALDGYSHPGADQELLWDTRRAPELMGISDYIDDVVVRGDVEMALKQFADRTLMVLASLPQQVIHNDINCGNVLYAGDDVCGLIDFGDMLQAPRILDVTVAGAYLRDFDDPVRRIRPLLLAYDEIAGLSDAEKSVVFDAVRARLCTTVSLLYWRLAARSVDDPYRQKTLAEEANAAEFLRILNALGRDRFNRAVFGT